MYFTNILEIFKVLVIWTAVVKVAQSHFFPYPEPPPPIQSFPFYAPHAKIFPQLPPPALFAPAPPEVHPVLSHHTIIVTFPQDTIGPAHAESPVLIPYGNAQTFPYKLLFSQFPPIVEGLVQRVQNYFSTYLGRPGYFPQDLKPSVYPPNNFPTNNFPTGTMTTVSTTPSPIASSTTAPPVPSFTTSSSFQPITTSSPLPSITTDTSSISITTLDPNDNNDTRPSISAEPQTSSSGAYTPPKEYGSPPNPYAEIGYYRYDPPSRSLFHYPKSLLRRFKKEMQFNEERPRFS